MVNQNRTSLTNLINLNRIYAECASSQEKLNQFSRGHEIIQKDIQEFTDGKETYEVAQYISEREEIIKVYTDLQGIKGMNLLKVQPFIKAFPRKLLDMYLRTPVNQLNH